MKYLVMSCALGLLTLDHSHVQAQTVPNEQRVYEYVVRTADGAVDAVADSVRQALETGGWTIVGAVDSGVPDGCPYSSQVVLGYRPTYGDVVARANDKTGPFGVLDRVNVFEDEEGVHVSVVNQRNIIRTVLMNDTGYQGFVEQHMQALRSTIEEAVGGSPSDRQYGQMRDRGYIGRTMGVMAGGRFDGKVDDVLVLNGRSLSEVADIVEQQLEAKGEKWGTGLVFRLDLPERAAVLFGTTGSPLDSKSFDIVGAGADDAREDLSCPGLAHAGAYPLEIVVAETEEGVAIRMVDSMYRMKMYFEDAGKIAFMKNMTMPGSIADELEKKLSPLGS